MASRDKLMKKIEDRIVPVDEAEEFLKILVYGRNGQGKTRFAATGPNCLLIDINEKGTRSARRSGAKVFHVNRWEDVTYIYWYLKRGNHSFETVAVDTLTALQDLCMKHVLGEEAERDPNKDPAMPTRREWGKLSELLKPLMLNFRNLPMNVVFTAQERVIGDDEELGEHVPHMSNANRATAMGAVDIIGRIYQKEIRSVNKKTKKEVTKWETRLLVGPHDEYVTKDRTGSLGRIVRNPTIPNMLLIAAGEES